MSTGASKEHKTPVQADLLKKDGGLASAVHLDNRPEAAQQAVMQQAAFNKERTSGMKACQNMADCSPVGETVKQLQAKTNQTGLPDQLKSGVESLSGMSLDAVKVHYNSSKPAQMQAHAYAQGTAIHVAPGQEKHLPHEAWHVVQQAQGRVQPTTQLQGVAVNDDSGLESEADVMGAKAMSTASVSEQPTQLKTVSGLSNQPVIQQYSYNSGTIRTVKVTGNNGENTFDECTKNTVTYNKGEAKQDGTITGEADWAGWLVNQANTARNATQLHVVNKRWGGKGGAKDGNIVPGSPAANSYHLHDAEKEFDKCFDGNDKAKENCSYECTATPAYGQNIDVKGGVKNFNDPTLQVKITYNGNTDTYDPRLGGGIQFKDGS